MMCVNKLVGIFLLFGLWHNAYGADARPTTCVEKQMLDLFTKWQKGHALPFPLPPIEIIKMQSFEGQYVGFGIKMSYTTGEMTLAGVNNFTVEELLVTATDTLDAAGIVQFPLLTLTADSYNLQGRAYAFYSLKGSGAMLVTFRNVKLMFGISLNPHGTGTQVSDIQLDFSVDGVQINLASASWPINKVLNSEAISIIDSYHSGLVNAATRGVKHTLGRHLATVTRAQLLSTFVGNCTDIKFE